MGRSVWHSRGFRFDAKFADPPAGLGDEKIIGQVARRRTIVPAADAITEHAFSCGLLGSHFFQSGKFLGAGLLLRGVGWDHALEHCLCPDRSREPLFGRASQAYPHEALGLLAVSPGSRWRFECRRVYGLLGLDWTAPLGLLKG